MNANTNPILSVTDPETNLTFSVQFDRWDSLQANRARWFWTVTDGEVSASGDDLTTVGDPLAPDALETLLSFAENAAMMGPDAFGPMNAALTQYSEEVGHLRYELFNLWRKD